MNRISSRLASMLRFAHALTFSTCTHMQKRGAARWPPLFCNSDRPRQGGGADSGNYQLPLLLQPPFVPVHVRLTSPSELRVIENVSPLDATALAVTV